MDDPDPACGEAPSGDNGTLDAELTVVATSDPFTWQFDASASHYEEGGTLNQPLYRFVFGDGEQTPAQGSAVVSHSYEAAGTYQAYVVVTDANGNAAVSESRSVRVELTITVTDEPVNAARLKLIGSAVGPAPHSVTFDATGSTVAPGYSITQYAWDFDGDGVDDLVGVNGKVSHVYTVAGEYTPTVTVSFTKDDDASDSETSVAKASVKATSPGTPGTPPAGPSAGGGSLGYLVLLPLLGAGLARRRRG